MANKPPLGSGERFAALTRQLSRRGVRNPRALAAYIGRQKYGAKRFAQLSAMGRRRARRDYRR
jgi:hypothetical protein